VRAARYHGRRDVRIEDVAEPDPGPDEVKLRVAFNGICGSDLHEYYSGPSACPTTPHPMTGAQIPVILGHELSGVVTAIGARVTDVHEGDQVAVEPLVTCGHCASCRSGRYHLCSRLAIHGLSTGGGGLAEYTVVNRSMVHRLPPNVTLAHGALVEPMSVALHAVRRAGAQAGQTAVVHGAGPIGIGALLALRAQNVDVIVVEPSPVRRDSAVALGAVHAIDPSAVDVVTAIRQLTGGLGATVAIEAAGAPASLQTALATTAIQGTVVVVAVHERPVELPPLSLLAGELTITGSVAYCNDFPAVIESMATGAYPVDPWVSTISLDDLVDFGFPALRDGDAVKILVDLGAP